MAESNLKEELEIIRNNYRDEQERIQRELNEVDVMVRQASSDVEKLAQREISVANRVRDLEVNLEKYGKAEIKNFYTTAQEVQMRLQMMRSQLEQLQDRQKAMQARHKLLSDIGEILNEVLGTFGGAKTADAAPSQGDNDSTSMIMNIIQAQEKERLRISLQMHDGPAQSMSNLVLRAEICQRLLERSPDQASAELTSLKSSINTTLQDIRKFIFDLRPMILDDLGLVPTIRRFASEFGDSNNLEVNIMVHGMEGRLPSHYEVTLFRFIQEALNNIARHAGANQARVLLNVSEGTLQVIVEDDGNGFHISDVLADQTGRRNMGINNMRQQIEVLLRGEFGIESAIGRGTRVAATVPLHQN